MVSENFAGKVEEACYCSWVFVDCFDKDINLIEMVTSCKKFPAAAAADEKSPDVSRPDAMCVQRCVPNQHPRSSVSHVRSPEPVVSLLKKLKGFQSRFRSGTLKN